MVAMTQNESLERRNGADPQPSKETRLEREGACDVMIDRGMLKEARLNESFV